MCLRKEKQESAEELGGQGDLSPAEADSETDILSNFAGRGLGCWTDGISTSNGKASNVTKRFQDSKDILV